jgi:hypothetical protein
MNEVIHHVLLTQPVASGNGILEVKIEAVMILRHSGRTAFGRHGVAAHRVHFRNQRDIQVGIGFRCGYCCA